MTTDKTHDLEPPPGAPGWVTPELLRNTVETWQPYYLERLTAADALDMLLAVSQLHDAIGMERTWKNHAEHLLRAGKT